MEKRTNKQPFKIPSIHESLLNDFQKGASIETIAAEYFRAGWLTYCNIEKAKAFLQAQADKHGIKI